MMMDHHQAVAQAVAQVVTQVVAQAVAQVAVLHPAQVVQQSLQQN